MNKYAYTTLLGTDDYLMPICGLYKSLQMVNSKYPLVVMVLDSVSTETLMVLEELDIQYRVFPDLFSTARLTVMREGRTLLHHEYFQIIMMNKFYCFELKDFDKVCYLDGDILVKKNIDFIFNYSTPAAKVLSYGDEREGGDAHIAGEQMLINPADYDFDYIYKEFTPFGFDESVLKDLYPLHKITDCRITDDHDYIFHAHAHCAGCQYWTHFNLNTPYETFNFVHDVVYNVINIMDIKNLYDDYAYIKDEDKYDVVVIDSSHAFDEEFHTELWNQMKQVRSDMSNTMIQQVQEELKRYDDNH